MPFEWKAELGDAYSVGFAGVDYLLDKFSQLQKPKSSRALKLGFPLLLILP